MATLIPNHPPAEISTPSERVVAEALCSQLPKDVRVFHSYPWLRQERDLDKPWQGEVIREGEADFVIVDPRYGFMVIEVKGGHMFYNPSAQRWDRQGATHSVKDPFAQAGDNLRALEKILMERSFPGGPAQMPFVRARAVVFPDCDYQGTLPPGPWWWRARHRAMPSSFPGTGISECQNGIPPAPEPGHKGAPRARRAG